jgi:hypothetical protein
LGGQLQKLRWEALDSGLSDSARDIAHAIEAVAWAAGIYCAGANIVDRPGGGSVGIQPVPVEVECADPGRITHAA